MDNLFVRHYGNIYVNYQQFEVLYLSRSRYTLTFDDLIGY